MHEVNANGTNIPAIGMGTWTLEGDQARSLVAKALESGYRHIDNRSDVQERKRSRTGSERQRACAR